MVDLNRHLPAILDAIGHANRTGVYHATRADGCLVLDPAFARALIFAARPDLAPKPPVNPADPPPVHPSVSMPFQSAADDFPEPPVSGAINDPETGP